MTKISSEVRSKLHLVLRRVRIAYPNVFEPKLNSLSKKEEYSTQIRFYEDNAAHMGVVKQIKEAMREAAEAYWGQAAEKFMREALDSKNTRGLRYDEEGGYFYINAKRRADQGAPRVVGRNPKMVLTAADGKVYSGAVVNAVVDVWCYSGTAKNGAKIPPGFSFTLCGIQFVEDGDPLGGTSAAKDADWEQLENEDEEPDFTDIP